MNYRSITILLLASALSFLLATNDSLAAKHQQQPNVASPGASSSSDPMAVSAAASSGSHQSKSWLPHAKSRSSRSLSDMFEKVKSKIFGNKKSSSSSSSTTQQQASPSSAVQSAQIQTSGSAVNQVARQPWDINSFNQQYGNQFSGQVSPAQYQWPAVNNAYLNNQAAFANQMSSYPSASPSSFSSIPVSGIQSMQAGGPLDALQTSASSQVNSPNQQQQQVQQVSGPAGILSSASHLISQYLSPGSNQVGVAGQQQSQQSQQQQQGQQNLLSPNQQSQYNEFASMLDSMVAQTGLNSPVQRSPNQAQYLPGVQQNGAMQASGSPSGSYPTAGANGGNPMMSMGADQDMMGSSNVQMIAQPGSSAPVQSSPVSSPSSSSAMQPQASQKSNMVSLAEQLAPGAQFNKLISFPFSLSNNDDPNKEGRFKLHIPFLNQHVKRSDQQQQQQQQLINANNQQQYYNQQQYVPSQNQMMLGQASQQVASIMSPGQSSGSSSLSSQSSGSPVSMVNAGISSHNSQVSPIQSSAVASLSSSPSQSPSVSVLSSQSVSSSSSISQASPMSSSSSSQ